MPKRRGSSPTPHSRATGSHARSRSLTRSSRKPTGAKSPCGAYRTCRRARPRSNTRPEMTHDPDAVTRVLFEDFAPAAIGAFYVIACAAIAVFCFGVHVEVRKYRRGSAADVEGR